MKKSISHLPLDKQEDIQSLVEMITKKIPQTEMIILYGSYATKDYVIYDETTEDGTTSSFMSDYDILVITSNISDKEAGRILDSIDDKYYQNPEVQTPVQFINEDIESLNKELEEGRYFYTELKQKGILLYDKGTYKLADPKNLRFDEIKEQAEGYYNEKQQNARNKFIMAKFAYENGLYKEAIFNLHQACENLFYATRLVFTLKNNKQHNLAKLLASVKKYSKEFVKIFPSNNDEEKRLFKMVKSAYVEARYYPSFEVTKEDIEALIPKIEKLFDLVETLCKEQINEYETLWNIEQKKIIPYEETDFTRTAAEGNEPSYKKGKKKK